MHTVLENMDIGELRGVGSEGNEEVAEMWAELADVDAAGRNGGLTPPARLASGRCEPPAEAGRWLGADLQVQAATTPGRNGGLTPPARHDSARQEDGRQEDDSNIDFPDDHALDDPALLEMRPARPQREIDLEALDYHLQGYSVRQIAKLQDVHPHTAFNRIKRGREIDAKDPLRAEGASLHAQADKLRQLERAFLPAAREGDFRSAQMILKIVDKLWRLGKFAREAEKARQRNEWVAAGSLPTSPLVMGQAADDPMVAVDELKSPLANEEVPSWEYLAELLPDRAEEIAKLRKDFRAAEKAEDDEVVREMEQRFSGPAAVPPQDELDAFMAEYARPGKINVTPVEPQFVRRPLTKKEKALQVRAKREQGANTARTERVQGASAGAYTNHENDRENVGQAVA